MVSSHERELTCTVRVQTLDAKKEWNEHFEAYIRVLDQKKPVIWTGDLNVAPTAIGAC